MDRTPFPLGLQWWKLWEYYGLCPQTFTFPLLRWQSKVQVSSPEWSTVTELLRLRNIRIRAKLETFTPRTTREDPFRFLRPLNGVWWWWWFLGRVAAGIASNVWRTIRWFCSIFFFTQPLRTVSSWEFKSSTWTISCLVSFSSSGRTVRSRMKREIFQKKIQGFPWIFLIG